MSKEEKKVIDYLIFHKYENSSKKEDMIDKVIEIIEKQQKELNKVRKKIEERLGILCMQLGSYERDNATFEQERIAGGINELTKIKELL